MKHLTLEDLQNYVEDYLSEEKREEVEGHLFSCDDCLAVYMTLVNEETLPELENSNFTDEVMSQIPMSQSKQRKRTNPAFLHYVIAASITFILMTSGVFQSMLGISSVMETSSVNTHEATVSQNIMDRALTLLEKVERTQKEEKK
ncbi:MULTISPECIES: anti-sigma factor family protein [Bacillus]|uniref:anti-sigma factor family protein n=1 Tax=Bacillus TaxID=1386 RepID=UPI000BB8A479|nr:MULTISPECIES: hypothetical protein [Bacillus]